MAKNADDRIWYIIAYLIPYMISGIVVLFLKGESNKRLRLHAMQSIFLGILMIILWIVFTFITFGFFYIIGALLSLFVWLYGLYVGFEAYNGRDVTIPTITEYAKRYSGSEEKSKSKK
jgi:uncharacterized membrane protein